MLAAQATSFTDVMVVLPIVSLVVGAMSVLLLTVAGGLSRPAPPSGTHLAGLSLLAIAAAAAALLAQGGTDAAAFDGAIAQDGVSQSFGLVICVGAGCAILVAMAYLVEHGLAIGEFCALILLASAGGLTVVFAQDLLVAFLGIELMSIAAYVLAGYRRALRRSQEAALKYFMYGAYASAVMVFGMALIWGEIGLVTGTPSLRYAALALTAGDSATGMHPLGWVGITLMLAGLAFKVAAAPFHMWAPDVYEGAPTPSAAFLSVGIKVAAFAALARLLAAVFGAGHRDVETASQVIEVLAISSMLVGNVLAVRQVQIKRMLAYSSIAHAGYVLTGLVALPQGPQAPTLAAVALYLLGYTVAGLGAFAVVLAFERESDRRIDLRIERLAGAGRAYPGLGVAMGVCLLSLAGIPPMAGFTGKVALFGAALQAGRTTLVLVAALCSAVGAFYYLRVLSVMFMREEAGQEVCVRSPWLTWALWVCCLATLGLGIAPSFYYSFARQALASWAG